jgi:hypothetical protein
LEGASDVYRELLCRGGVPQTAFWDYLANLMVGKYCYVIHIHNVSFLIFLEVETNKRM